MPPEPGHRLVDRGNRTNRVIRVHERDDASVRRNKRVWVQLTGALGFGERCFAVTGVRQHRAVNAGATCAQRVI